MLRGGTVRLYEAGQLTDRLYVAGGFAEITPERCTVLADEAIPVAELSRSEAESRLQQAQAAYDGTDPQDIAALDLAMSRIQSARAMLEAAEAG